MSLHTGVQRWVILIGSLAIKIPHLHWLRRHHWRAAEQAVLNAAVANMREAVRYRNCDAKFKPLLCPVLHCGPFGLWLIMRRADHLGPEACEQERDAIEAVFGDVDNHSSNFGWLGGRLVLLDYGDSEFNLPPINQYNFLSKPHRDMLEYILGGVPL